MIGEVQVSTQGVITPAAAYTWGSAGLVSERRLAAGQSYWYHYGPQGETRQLTGSSGTVTNSYSYSAYGVGGADPAFNPFGFGGQFGYYSDYGIILCGARWYDPQQGRWLSRDPIDYDGGDNLYAYCDGDPVGNADPEGLSVDTHGQRRELDHLLRPTLLQRAQDWWDGKQRRKSKFSKQLDLFLSMPGVGPAGVGAGTFVGMAKFEGAVGAVKTAGALERVAQIGTVSSEASRGARSFETFAAFKRAMGAAGEGRAWHHIVEQCRADQFGAKMINAETNLVKIDAPLNAKLNGLYSSIREDITGSTKLRVRDWLKGKSWKEQYEFGKRAMDKIKKGEW